MRALVTGGAGFIGSHIVDRLLEQGAAVLVVDDLSTGLERNLASDAEFRRLDVGDPALVELATAFRSEVVVHCAAQASVVASMADPGRDARSNILGGINVRDAAVAAGCRQVLYITTGGALYGQPEYLPMDEGHPIRPESGYGLSKWTSECYFRLLLPASMPLKTLRLANVYGPRQNPEGEAGVVAIFAARMVRGAPVTIYGDGEQTRDLVYVADVARAVALALAAPESLTVNVSTAAGTSVNAVYRMLRDACGSGPEPVYAPERPGEVRHSVLANDHARDVMGWSPEVGMTEGLWRTLAWVRSEATGNRRQATAES